MKPLVVCRRMLSSAPRRRPAVSRARPDAPLCTFRWRHRSFQAAVSLALAAPEGVLVGLERVAEDALRDRGNERVVLVVERFIGLDDMSGSSTLNCEKPK